MQSYNGHKSWNHWNVSLWINNDEDLYFDAWGKVQMIGPREAAKEMMLRLNGLKTPDGAPYTFPTVYAALQALDNDAY